MSLPRTLRITRHRDYEAVKTTGRSVGGRLLVLGLREDDSLAHFKAGFIIPKAVGCAVERNLIKRRLREIVRRSETPLKSNQWIVTIARRGATRASFTALRKEWFYLARKIGLLATESRPQPPRSA